MTINYNTNGPGTIISTWYEYMHSLFFLFLLLIKENIKLGGKKILENVKGAKVMRTELYHL